MGFEPGAFGVYLSGEKRLADSTVFTRVKIVRSLAKCINLWDVQA